MLSPLSEYPALGRCVATIRLCRMLLPDLCGGGSGEREREEREERERREVKCTHFLEEKVRRKALGLH